jgi:hypothetical protein
MNNDDPHIEQKPRRTFADDKKMHALSRDAATF